MSDERRGQVYCDQEIQGGLMWRAIAYWCFGIFATGFFLFLWAAGVSMPDESSMGIVNELARQFGPAVVGSLLILPLIVYDVFRQSNYFAGPVYRVRKALRSMAEGETVQPITLRDGDLLTDIVDDLNIVMERLRKAEAALAVDEMTIIDDESEVVTTFLAETNEEPLIALVAEPVLALAAEVQRAARPQESTTEYAFPAGVFADPVCEETGGYVG